MSAVLCGMKSKKALFKFLTETFNKPAALGQNSIGDETYGKDSRIYLWNIQAVWGVSRKELEDKLEDNGFKVNRRWGQACGSYKAYDATEVRVSYFKGHHWDV